MFKPRGKNPETSIIIRTFNEEKHIGDLLEAIKSQDYCDYEIILVDSGSTDKTLEIAKRFDAAIIKIESRDFTFGYSLNMGCQKAKGKYLVFVSAHVLPRDNQWLGNLLEPFKDEKVAVVYGKQVGDETSKFSEKRDFERFFADSCAYPNNANAAIRKELWKKHPFDEYLFGLEDMEWAKRMKQLGLPSYYEPKAAVLHIHNEKWAQVFNRYRREAIAAARIDLANPPQAKHSLIWLAGSLSRDLLASLPDISLGRLEEIARFRYYQWKGTRQGWLKDRGLDISRDKYALFYPTANKAVVIKRKNHAAIEEFPLPEIKPGDILVQVGYVGICRTDLEVYDGSLGYYKNELAKYPIVPGHEFSGTIVRIGANNKYRERFKVGQGVVGECVLSRGSKRQEVGVINYNGAYSRFIVMPGDFIHKIPHALDLKTACLAEPLAVVLRAIRRVKQRLKPGAEIAIIGAGPIGNLCAQVLSLEGYRTTIFDKNHGRLEFLKDKVKAVLPHVSGLKNFDLIIEATGSAEVLRKVLEESRQDSTLVLLGFPYGVIDYNFEDLVGGEKVIVSSVGGEWDDFKKALELLPELDTVEFTKAVIPLNDFQRAWDMHRSQKNLKIILKP